MEIILFFYVDNFDCDEFVRFVVFSLVDMGAVTEADLIRKRVGEMFYFFEGYHAVHSAVPFGWYVIDSETDFVFLEH